MAVTVTIWHNPRCSKSRETLALLRARGIEPAIRLYLENPPSRAELADVVRRLGPPATALARTGDAAFADLGLTTHLAEGDLLAALAAHPALIERPLVIVGDRAALGRPPQAVLALL